MSETIISGSIAAHLQDLYHGAVKNTSRKYKKDSKDITSEDVKKWFEETERKAKYKNVIQREENLINVYLDIIENK